MQNRGAFVAYEVFNQLSNVLQNLTSSVQANNTPAPGNAESTRTIENGTLNDESPLTVENSIPNVDYMDTISEASGQQPLGTRFDSILIAISTNMGYTVLPGAHPDLSLPLLSPRRKKDNIW